MMANTVREELLALAASMSIVVPPGATDAELERLVLNSKVLPAWLRERAVAEGVTLPLNLTFETARMRVGEVIVRRKRYMARMVLAAQGVHLRIVAIKYGGFIVVGGVERAGDVWRPTEGRMSTLYVTDFDNDVTIVGEVGESF